MAGTRDGGILAAEINKTKQGEDFYVKIGRKGGQNGTTGGYYANPKLAKTSGIKGGNKSGEVRRAKIQPKLDAGWRYQDRKLKPPHELDPTRVVYLNHRSMAANRDPEWDKKFASIMTKSAHKKR